jgi:hypothetical protein
MLTVVLTGNAVVNMISIAGASSHSGRPLPVIAHRFWTIDDPVEHFRSLNTFFEHIGTI